MPSTLKPTRNPRVMAQKVAEVENLYRHRFSLEDRIIMKRGPHADNKQRKALRSRKTKFVEDMRQMGYSMLQIQRGTGWGYGTLFHSRKEHQ